MKNTEILNIELIQFIIKQFNSCLTISQKSKIEICFRIDKLGGGGEEIILSKKEVKELIKFLKFIK